MKKAFVLLLCLMLAGCTAQKTEITNIKIPILGTAQYFEADDSFLKGAKMAVEDANAENEKFVFSTEILDDENNYEKGMAKFDGLMNDENTVAVIGTQNFAILNSAAVSAKKAGKILVMPHGSEENVRASKNEFVFANTFSAEDMGFGMGQYLAENGIKRVAVCYNNADLSHSIVSSLSANKKVQIVDFVRGDITDDNFEQIYDRWEALDVTGVAIIHNTDEAFSIAKKIKTQNINMTIIGDYAFDIPDEITAMGALADGLVMSFIFPVESGKKLDAFNEKYSALYGEQSTLWAAHGYDSVKMITDTIVQNDTANPAEIAEFLRKNGYDGITHSIKFDENGAMTDNKPFFEKVIDGQFQIVGGQNE